MASPACIEATFREGSVVDPRFPAAVNTYMPTALTAAEAVLRALAPVRPRQRIAGGSGSAALVLGGRDAAEQPRLCALRDFQRRHRRPRRQGRRVGDGVSSEQLQNRPHRDHRVRVSHPGRALRDDRRLRRRRRMARRPGLCPRVSDLRRRRALLHAHRQARDRTLRQQRRPARRQRRLQGQCRDQ